MCCDMLGVVGSSLKMVKFRPTTPNTSQHVATGWPNARKMLRPTMLRYVELACCDRLAGALKTRASCLIRGSEHLETIKALGLWPPAFRSVFRCLEPLMKHSHSFLIIYYINIFCLFSFSLRVSVFSFRIPIPLIQRPKELLNCHEKYFITTQITKEHFGEPAYASEKFFLRDAARNPERARKRCLAHSDSQSLRRIWLMLPAHRVSHIIMKCKLFSLVRLRPGLRVVLLSLSLLNKTGARRASSSRQQELAQPFFITLPFFFF